MRRSVKITLLILAAITWTPLGMILWDRHLAFSNGRAYGIRMGGPENTFEYEHEWRQNHRGMSAEAAFAPSEEAAEDAVARQMLKMGYKLPKWWEVIRWDEKIPAEFRQRIERMEAGR
jgi:hypothetical protein